MARTNLMCALMFCLCCTSASMQTRALPSGVKTHKINGYDMAYIERGSGPTVVLVHGAINDYRVWEPQMAPLSERYHVIAVSLRHYYPERWDGNGTDFSITQHAADVASFIRKLGVGPVHLLGHSRGGNVVLQVAETDPSLLRTLVLPDPGGLGNLLPAISSIDPSQTMSKAVSERLKSGDIDEGLRMFMANSNGPGAWEALTESQKQIRRDNAVTITAVTSASPQTTCAEGASIPVPVLIMNGELSPKQFTATSELFQRCLKNVQRVVIPKASHGMFRTHPEASNRALLSFLDKH